jgi:NifU-like protein involved in Fe-S cluster formation
MASVLYTPDILRLATQIPHLARLENPKASDERRAPICGSRIAVDVDVDDEGRVSAFGQEVRACALGQAAASLLGAEVVGRTPEELATTAVELARWLKSEGDMPSWPGLSLFEAAKAHPGRHGAICLPFEAAAAAARQAKG